MPRARRAPAAPQRTARNDDYTDREILANINDVLDGDGWATTTEIARRCGFTDDGKGRTLAIKVGARLAYMRAIGLIESTDPDLTRPATEPGSRDRRWRPTDHGRMILGGHLTKAVTNALEKMEPGAQVLLIRELMRQGFLQADRTLAYTIKRETEHGLHQRKLGSVWR